MGRERKTQTQTETRTPSKSQRNEIYVFISLNYIDPYMSGQLVRLPYMSSALYGTILLCSVWWAVHAP